MSAGAVSMMIVAMIVLWGGLALAVWNLNRRSRSPEEHYRRDL